jgi:TupA-like ATPgrasp
MSLRMWQGAVLFFARVYFLVAHPGLTCQFVRRLKYLPNPGAPQRYHEKLLWRKIVDHNPIFPKLSDKLAAKRIVQMRCHEVAVAQVLWAGTDPQFLPADLVTGDVVVKTNHSFRTNIFVADGKPAYPEIVDQMVRWMAISHDRTCGEWGYRDVSRRIFVEEMLVLGGGGLPTDIKVHAFAMAGSAMSGSPTYLAAAREPMTRTAYRSRYATPLTPRSSRHCPTVRQSAH